MHKLPFLLIGMAFGLTACAAYVKPLDLRFQDRTIERNQMITVERDGQLCDEDTLASQKCPIDFYIDSFLSGSFYANNTATYYLKPEIYNLKVKNCTTDVCQSCNVDLQPQQLTNKTFVLSVDVNGRPTITNAGQELQCSSTN